MFTVKDVVRLLREAKSLFINWNGGLTPLDTESELQMAAYGDFLVEKVLDSHDRNTYEIVIKVTPQKLEV